MYEVKKGADGGWPYVYYDQFQRKKILSPEYGGDGKKTGKDDAMDPTAVFQAHLGPNGLLFYTGKSFPSKYRHGAFIAFHSKSAELQKGFLLGFVPFKKGKPSANWEIFAENFVTDKGQHRPCGLAQGPDGSLFVTDDSKGNIYRIEYKK
jgi:glucose/arabinose dehydrogenase